jgi:hypothetical protein
MKKIYKSPEMKVVEIRTTHLCNLSLDPNAKATHETTVLSRRNNWDDWDVDDDF